MKTKIFLTVAAFGMAFGAQAAVLTVSNNVNSPGQYTDLQAAIDASSPTDTILVHGSPTSYGSIDITWPLTIIGAGYNNPYGENTELSNVYFERANASISASGSHIMGFDINSISFSPSFSGGNNQNQELSDIIVERCQFRGSTTFRFGSTFTNITVKNCYYSSASSLTVGFEGSTSVDNNYSYYTNVRFINNIFGNGGRIDSDGSDLSGVNFKNNIFLNGSSPLFSLGTNLPQMVLENNIFYGVWPEGCELCAFNNNITFSCNDDQLVYSGNPGSVGSGNLIGQNPQFVSYPVLGGAFDYSHDYNLQPGSPGIGAGTDGSDIGIYGGAAPFVDPGTNPTIPQMMYIDFQGPSSVGFGGTLDVEFRSHRQD